MNDKRLSEEIKTKHGLKYCEHHNLYYYGYKENDEISTCYACLIEKVVDIFNKDGKPHEIKCIKCNHTEMVGSYCEIPCHCGKLMVINEKKEEVK